MKKTMILFALFAFTTVFAQENKNKEKETLTTKTTVKDSKGSKTSEESVSTSKTQTLKLSQDDAYKVNQEVVRTSIKIDTEVSYEHDGNRFQFLTQQDRDGYRLMTIRDNAKNEEFAVIKPTSRNGFYIISQDGKSSFGYFNDEGNFVVESYDEKADKVVPTVYRLLKE